MAAAAGTSAGGAGRGLELPIINKLIMHIMSTYFVIPKDSITITKERECAHIYFPKIQSL